MPDTRVCLISALGSLCATHSVKPLGACLRPLRLRSRLRPRSTTRAQCSLETADGPGSARRIGGLPAWHPARRAIAATRAGSWPRAASALLRPIVESRLAVSSYPRRVTL